MTKLLVLIAGLLYLGTFVAWGVYDNHALATTMFIVSVVIFNVYHITIVRNKLFNATKMKAIKIYNDIILANIFCALFSIVILATYFLYQLK
jgi:hypothetical protein